MKIASAKLNKEYIVIDIEKNDTQALKKICSLGILPGLKIKIVQKQPMIIFEVFNSRFAIDNELADKIIVKETN
ncbi:ferrous iron transport protein A [Deferribacter desulfuricans SSM1]|uniref:Ferrous iron transport protein A n=1 Tax=Deferribacter desulfuricans (strain DSM 14783 / JCM 11476 / NBRC 101012 / SSM1) TaxID=639282 RepID=D3PBF7_DEFDS|nr:FeoA family protein [Deferribacter desulfuricans]BAI79930.1 ferrous iron transport protein A [Deferribacter desulfuricans SSM1]